LFYQHALFQSYSATDVLKIGIKFNIFTQTNLIKMKKLILLSAFLIFACGSDSEDTSNFRDYLNSNIFSIKYDDCIVLAIWPPQECLDEWKTEKFAEFTLDDNTAILLNVKTFKNYPYDCGSGINTSQCYSELYGIEGVIISETEDVIIWELTNGQQYIINRNDNSISITPLEDNYSIAPLGLVSGEYLLSNEENLNDRINERDNFICPLSCP
jgi:hypothetical protein